MLHGFADFMTGQGRFDPYGGLKPGDQGPRQPLPWYARFSPAMSPTGLAVRGIASRRQPAKPLYENSGNQSPVGSAIRGIAGLF